MPPMIAALQLVPLVSVPAADVPTQRPNIPFIIADDASPHFGEAYGCKWVRTPNIDRLARDGLVFDHAYTPTARCTPSRSAILTGRNPLQPEDAANHQSQFPAKFVAFSEALGQAGMMSCWSMPGFNCVARSFRTSATRKTPQNYSGQAGWRPVQSERSQMFAKPLIASTARRFRRDFLRCSLDTSHFFISRFFLPPFWPTAVSGAFCKNKFQAAPVQNPRLGLPASATSKK